MNVGDLPVVTDDECASAFGPRWSSTFGAAKGSRKRHTMRRQLRISRHMDGLKAAGASCATCRSCERATGPAPNKPHQCSAHSDFHGTVFIELTGLCADYERKPT